MGTTLSDYEMDESDDGSKGSVLEASQHLGSYTPFEFQELCKLYEEEEEEEEEEEQEEEEEDTEGEEDQLENVYENEDGQGFNELYFAIERHDTETVRKLLKASLDVNVLDEGRSVRSQSYAIVKELLYKNDDVDSGNAFDRTSLHVTPRNDLLKNAHEMLQSNADANKFSRPIAPEMSCAEIVKALIDYVGGINAIHKNGETALHLAARNDRNALVKVLFGQSEERDGRSSSKLVVDKVRPDELEMSKQPNRNKADACCIPHQVATQGGNLEISKYPLSCNASVKSVCTGQAIPLQVHLTAEREHAEIVENLIVNGANVNACNNAKMTPLHLASKYGNSSIVEILLDNLATVDVNEQSLETPFYLAAKNGHADVVEVLLRRGICDFVANSETPLHAAVTGRHRTVIEVILKYSSRISGKLANDEQKLQENAKNLTETRDVKPIELVKPGGRRVSAGIVWTETVTPFETML